MTQAWYVYLLECSNDSIYTGIAVDVEARLQQHRSGKGARYTRAWPPRRLLAVIAYPDRTSAARAEYAIKQQTRAAKWLLIQGQATPPLAGVLCALPAARDVA